MGIFWGRTAGSDATQSWCSMPGLVTCAYLERRHPQRQRPMPWWPNNSDLVVRMLDGSSSVQLQLRWHGLLVAVAGSCCCMVQKLQPCLCHREAHFGMVCPVECHWLLIQIRCSFEFRTVIPGIRNPSAAEAVASWQSTQAMPRSRHFPALGGSSAIDSTATGSACQS